MKTRKIMAAVVGVLGVGLCIAAACSHTTPGSQTTTCAVESKCVDKVATDCSSAWEVKADFPQSCVSNTNAAPANRTNCNEENEQCKRTVQCYWDTQASKCKETPDSGGSWERAKKKVQKDCPNG